MDADCERLNTHDVKPKANTKITQRRAIANKSTEQMKWDCKKTINPKEGIKRGKREPRTDGIN